MPHPLMALRRLPALLALALVGGLLLLRADGSSGPRRRRHRRSRAALRPRPGLRCHRHGQLRQRPRRHPRRRHLGRRRPHAGRRRRPREAPEQRHGGPRRDHGPPRRLRRVQPGHAVLPLGTGQPRHLRLRQRLPVRERQRVPRGHHHGQLVRREGHRPQRRRQPRPRRLEVRDLHADRHHGNPLRGRRAGRPEHRRHRPPERHRRWHDHQQRPRRVQLRHRQQPQGPGPQLPDLRPGPRRGRGRPDLADRREPAGRRRGRAHPRRPVLRHQQPDPADDRLLRLRHQLDLLRPGRHLGLRIRHPPGCGPTDLPRSP